MALVGVELETLVFEPDAQTSKVYGGQTSELCIYPERNIYGLWYSAKYTNKQIFLSSSS